jgi:hypothetical protein
LSKLPAADTIVGMFLVLDSAEHEHFNTGEIVAAVGNCYLIQFDRLELDQPQPPAELYTLEELSGSCENCGQKRANLFKSRADMEQWIAWLNKPEKPEGQSGKVVHLKKPH